MRRLAIALCLALFPIIAIAQSAVPERRVIETNDTDFYGSDLTSIFDTTLDACRRACLADSECKAFTFNERNNSCFPKSGVTDRVGYAGAISGTVLNTDARVLAAAQDRQAEIDFLTSRDFDQARSFAVGIPKLHNPSGWTAEALRSEISAARAGGNPVRALRLTGALVALEDKAADWADYGRIAAGIRTNNSSDQRTFWRRALRANINAYLRSESDPQRATILGQMADTLEKTQRGRDMISALRLAQNFQFRDEAEEALDKAIAKYGFRVVETTTDSDAARPRICATFSEPLASAGVDYDQFVQRDVPGLVIDTSDRQLCVDGVQHGQRYRLILRAGLPAESGEITAKPFEVVQYVRDRSPSVRFPGRAYVLPATEAAALPIETVNLDTVQLKLRRVSDRNLLRAIQNNYFGRPLSPWEEERFASDIAEEVWTGTGAVQNTLNQDMTTRLPMEGVLADLGPGIYALQAGIAGADPYESSPATQWFVVSDIGLATLLGADGLHVFTRSLATTDALAGLKVTLLSRSNAVLGEAETDAEGYARFDPGLTRGLSGASPAMITVEGQSDIAFMPLTDPAFDLSDRGVEGRTAPGPIDLFVTTDRGAYRAGETIHVTALARDGTAQAIANLPLTAILTRPDGVEHTRQVSDDIGAGGHVLSFPLTPSVPRGTWRLALHADPDAPPIETRTLLVEDFLPERIDVELALPDGQLRLTDQPGLNVTATYLFGAPGANLPVEADLRLRSTRKIDGRPGYVFGRHDAEGINRFSTLDVQGRTDDAGELQIPVTFPDIEAAGRPLNAELIVRVSEGSGRPVERSLTRAIAPDGPMIGIKPLFEDIVPEGAKAAFEVIALTPELAPAQMRVKWTVNRVERRYQWYQLYGNWNWDPVTRRSRVATGEADLGNAPLRIESPVEWGEYEIVVERLGGDYVAASSDFYAGWYAPADASSTPDTLDVSLDKDAYRPGETARLRINPRYDGLALVRVVSNRLIDMRAVEVSGETVIELPVTDDWGSGAYVTATLVRPMDVAAGRNPARALGLMHASVDPGDKALNLVLSAPTDSDPRGPLTVELDAGRPGQEVWATVAAVDVGILNLTGFDTPDPTGHYFGQRRLGVEMRDVYGRLIDGLNGALGQVRSGGDAAQQMRLESPPPTEDLVAFFSGPVRFGADGKASVTFDIPEFNGTVRVMAVAWSPDGVGDASADVLVRDPVVLTASLPRFLAPGDEARMLLEIVHATGPAGRVGLDVTADGVALGLAPSGVTLEEKGKAVLSVPVRAGDVGDHLVRVAMTTPDGRQLTKELRLPVRVNDPEVMRTSRFPLADGGRLTLDENLFAGFRPGTGTATLALGPIARMDAPGLLSALDRYPYGCTEQITSRAMPLLYFENVASAMGLGQRAEINKRIDQAVELILTRQASNGSFGLWQPVGGDFWLHAYVTDFLSRARAQGVDVPDRAFRSALDNLRNRVNFSPDFDTGGEAIAYALLVLAREGAASMGDLRYYADVKGNDFATPLAAAQLGAALAQYGDPVRADKMFTIAGQKLAGARDPNRPVWRADYGTTLRDSAGVLALAVESGSNAIDRDPLITRIANAQGRSTQEAVWSLLAVNALIPEPGAQGFTLNGSAVEGPLVRVLEGDTFGQAVTVGNNSGAESALTLTTFGVPEVPPEKGGKGFAIDRFYFTMEGEPVRLDQVETGTRLVTMLRVTPFQDSEARLMVNDPLPAGFEIDNPSLLASGDVRALDWLKLDARPEHTEFRSDRFLAQVDWRSGQPFELAYIVRAISPGRFHHPAASVEDMYRPDYRANTESGRLVVTE